MKFIAELVEEIENGEMGDFVSSLLESFDKDFLTLPAARGHHHNYEGGLYDHTKGVLGYAKVAGAEEGANLDIVQAGAVLHDIGKVFSYKILANGAIMKTDTELMVGHIAMGSQILSEHYEENPTINFSDYQHLQHIICSHHGEVSNGWGSTVDPRTPEAVIVHFADLMDSRVRTALDNKKRTGE